MIILKATKNQGFNLSRKHIFGKSTGREDKSGGTEIKQAKMG